MIADRSTCYFNRPGVYGERGTDYPDNPQRYVMFGRAAALAAARFIRPDVLHAHDWHASVAPIVARADPALREALAATLTERKGYSPGCGGIAL